MAPTIFISIASYLDSMLFFTINEAYSKATYPSTLRIGVVDQNHEDQREKIATLPYAAQIRYIHVKPQDTLGVSWARSLVFSLYDGENYLLQIDSHTLFEQGWDEKLITQIFSLMGKSQKPILTTYPHPFTMDNGVPVYQPDDDPQTVLVLRPLPDEKLTKDRKLLGFHAKHMFTKEPVLGCHIAAGFLFTLGSFVDEVPYDPFMYFHGEEQCLSLRAYTQGWDIYHPRIVPLRHLYKQSNGPVYVEHHWYGEVDQQRAFVSQYLISRSARRFNKLLSSSQPIGVFSLGYKRTLDDYTKLSGIDYKKLTIDDPFHGRLA